MPGEGDVRLKGRGTEAAYKGRTMRKMYESSKPARITVRAAQ